jgi:hypothetical protein
MTKHYDASLLLMRSVLLLWVLGLISFFPAQAHGEESTCLQYHVLDEQILSCGPQGYALGFGARYCDRFSALGISDLSAQGLAWRDATRACLLEDFTAIATDSEEPTCRDLKIRAFQSHPPCYTDPLGQRGGQNRISFCKLEPRDVLRVLQVVEPLDLLSPLAIQQNVRIAGLCADEWLARGQRSRADTERLAFWRELNIQWTLRLMDHPENRGDSYP